MKLSDLSADERQYNDESNLLDSLYEFHPDFFEDLTPTELDILGEYYLLNRDVPENVFTHRASLLRQKPDLKIRAEQVFAHVMQIARIE